MRGQQQRGLEDVLAETQLALERGGTVDHASRLEARQRELDAMLRDHDERRVSPWYVDGAELWCVAARPDGTRVTCTAGVRGG